MDHTTMDRYLGKTLDDRYEILEVIGSGGMAVVYKALCHKTNRYVAVKILRDDMATDADSRRRFLTESKAISMLNHPNVVTVYDVSCENDPMYIVMELVDGISLKQYMQKRGVLTWEEVMHFAGEIAKALSHAHSKGIIHRDIKPHNILLTKDGMVKVADFGIARLQGTQNTVVNQEALGSVHYISPEQARGLPVDARTDIYSLGVVMYEMLTGRLPFEGESAVSVAMQHINATPPQPHDIVPEIPPGIEAITMKAMKADVEQRYQSMEELLEDIRRFHADKNAPVGVLAASAAQAETAAESTSETAEEATPETAAAPENTPDGGEAEASAEEAGDGIPLPEEISEQELDHAESLDPDLYSGKKYVVKQNVEPISDKGELSYDKYVRRRSRSKKVSMLSGILIVLLFLVGCFAFLWNSFVRDVFEDSVRVTVPSFVGQNYNDVLANQEYLDKYHFTVTTESSETVEKDLVIRQTPEAGKSLAEKQEGIEIALVVSSGIDTVEIPETYNHDYRDAANDLWRLGFTVEYAFEESDSVTKNFVIRSEPEAGSRLAEGETVKLYVSGGPEMTMCQVPELRGMTQEEAEELLAQEGLTLGEVTTASSSKYEYGQVMRQGTRAGREVNEGTPIDLVISKGPAETGNDTTGGDTAGNDDDAEAVAPGVEE